MNCKDFENNLLLYLEGKLPPELQDVYRIHINSCDSCSNQVAEYQQLWKVMDTPELSPPEDKVKARFYDFLETQSDSTTSPKVKKSWLGVKNLQWRNPILGGLIAAVLILGVAIGYLLDNPKAMIETPQATPKLVLTTSEKNLIVALRNQSASERIEAIQASHSIQSPHPQLVIVLLNTLNQDENPNVRLATLEVLKKYSNQPKVRIGLIQALEQQTSPLIQLAIIDLITGRQYKDAIPVFNELLQKPALNGLIKKRIKKSLEILM